jgi:hypothetical protein
MRRTATERIEKNHCSFAIEGNQRDLRGAASRSVVVLRCEVIVLAWFRYETYRGVEMRHPTHTEMMLSGIQAREMAGIRVHHANRCAVNSEARGGTGESVASGIILEGRRFMRCLAQAWGWNASFPRISRHTHLRVSAKRSAEVICLRERGGTKKGGGIACASFIWSSLAGMRSEERQIAAMKYEQIRDGTRI